MRIRIRRLAILLVPIILIFVAFFIFASKDISDYSLFPTDPPNNNKISPIVIYGDSRTGHDNHRKIVEAITKVNPGTIFHTGDLVEEGRDPKDWEIFNEITSSLLENVEFYPALGNHEKNSPLYFENFELPHNERWYSVEINNIHFIILDTNSAIGINSEQYQWLEDDLEKIDSDIKFTIIVFHHPAISSGVNYHPRGDEKSLQESIVPLFEKYNVDLVFSGHVHAYEKLYKNGIYYVITGGGGAPLHIKVRTSPYSQKYIKDYHFCQLDIYDGEISVKVLDADLKIIDFFTVK